MSRISIDERIWPQLIEALRDKGFSKEEQRKAVDVIRRVGEEEREQSTESRGNSHASARRPRVTCELLHRTACYTSAMQFHRQVWRIRLDSKRGVFRVCETPKCTGNISTALQGHFAGVATQLHYTVVTQRCNATKKGLTPI